jgi:hypothetical protein
MVGSRITRSGAFAFARVDNFSITTQSDDVPLGTAVESDGGGAFEPFDLDPACACSTKSYHLYFVLTSESIVVNAKLSKPSTDRMWPL